jgi:hypothetical protein
VLIISSLLCLFVRQILIKDPDLGMNISDCVTRSSPYIPLPANGTFMDAPDRAKLFRDSKVRFRDVKGQTEVGRLTFGLLGESKTLDIMRVRKGLMYN